KSRPAKSSRPSRPLSAAKVAANPTTPAAAAKKSPNSTKRLPRQKLSCKSPATDPNAAPDLIGCPFASRLRRWPGGRPVSFIRLEWNGGISVYPVAAGLGRKVHHRETDQEVCLEAFFHEVERAARGNDDRPFHYSCAEASGG